MELSKEYLKWIKETNQSNLTRNQATFANWCLENKDMIGMIGGFYEIFFSIRKFLRKPIKKENAE